MVLPEPDGPTIAVVAPAASVHVMFCTAGGRVVVGVVIERTRPEARFGRSTRSGIASRPRGSAAASERRSISATAINAGNVAASAWARS